LREPRKVDAVHRQCACIDFALGIQEAMEFLAGGPAIENFHATDFDDAMAGARFKAGGFNVDDNLSHGDSLKEHQELLREVVGFTSPPMPCARSRTFGRIGVSV
jgi:hypothetical protein